MVFEDALKKSLAAKELLPVYILFGEENYLKKFYSGKISKTIAEPDDIFNFSRFEPSCDLQEVYDCTQQFPMCADGKYVELFDFDFEKCDKSDFERLLSLIDELPDTTTLLLRFETVDFDPKKSAKFKKLVTACEKKGGLAVNLAHRGTPELVKMLCDGALKRGCKFETSAARFLIETAGDDISILQNELIKLCAFKKGQTITSETVEQVCCKTVEASIFNLTKFIFACDSTKALCCLDELLYMKIEPMAIFYTLSGAYVDMVRVFAAANGGEGAPKIMELYPSAYRNKAFLLDNARNTYKKIDFNRLNLSMEAIIKADTALKSTGSDPRIVLEQLIVRLIYIFSKGENIDKG